MQILCLVDHMYQERAFEAGEVYDLESDLAMRLMANYGPPAVQRDPRNPGPVKFSLPETPPAPEDEVTRDALLALASHEHATVDTEMTNEDLKAAIQANRDSKE